MSNFIPPKRKLKLMRMNIRMPRINIYVCEYACETVAVDVDKGVAPWQIRCKATGKRKICDENGQCTGTARASNYPTDFEFAYVNKIKWELGLPTAEEIEAMVKENPASEKAIREYCNGERLLLRPRSDKPMLYHEVGK